MQPLVAGQAVTYVDRNRKEHLGRVIEAYGGRALIRYNQEHAIVMRFRGELEQDLPYIKDSGPNDEPYPRRRRAASATQ